MKKSYEQIIETIQAARRFGNLPGKEVMEIAIQKLQQTGARIKDIPYIHVAGTNGKGSVCAFLNSILQQAGKKVGVFTSPHLVDFRERIVVNGEMIAKEKVEEIGNFLLEQDFGVSPTMFDYTLLMALLYFTETSCDVMIIETGLGGRLDSTNALGTPKVTVITKIGLDHMSILGNTIAQIATEKAGIIKKGTILVLEQQEEESALVLEQAAYEKQAAELVKTEDVWRERIAKLPLRMLGTHQWENATAAMLAAVKFLQITDIEDIWDSLIVPSLVQTIWRGRMEILMDSPFFMVDGAHNSHGVHALAKSLLELFPDEKFRFFMGVMEDKDYMDMIQEILPLALDVCTVTPESERALGAETLAQKISAYGVEAKSIGEAEHIYEYLHPTEKNIAFGSLYFVGELLKK